MDKLNKYNSKRNFDKTNEPLGKISKKNKKLRFVVQHHIARRDHYDLRLEYDGVLISWAVPKGPSYNAKDKRLAVKVEDHPFSYRNFEGIIPKGEYGGGIVMLWDEGYWEALTKPNFEKGSFKFILKGSRLKGIWTLIHYKENNWLLIKEDDEFYEYEDINKFNKSIRTNRTMEEIASGITKKAKKNNKENLTKIKITNPDKLIYKSPKITKLDVIKYYEKVSFRMLPFLKERLISTIRCPEGIDGDCFFKKHLETKSSGIKRINISSNNDKKEDYYYITNTEGLLSEVQMNSIEFHIWGSKAKKIDKPDIMVFDLDPDELMPLKKVREGVKDLKSILDEFNLKSYLKTSGGKGYHVVVPIKENLTWQEFRGIAKNIAKLMETKWPEKYTSNMRKDKRKGKIFIDWVRNTKGSTSVAPYSLRARKNAPVSMPIKWSELDKVKPNEITMKEAIKRMKRKDPWEHFFD